MKTVHNFQQRVTYIEAGAPHVRNMDFTVSFADLSDSPEKLVKVQEHLKKNVFVFFDQEMILDDQSGTAQFGNVSFPYFGFGIDIVSQDLSEYHVIADALSVHLSHAFSCDVQAYGADVDDNKSMLRSLQISVKQMRRVQLFDVTDGILRGYEVLTDRTDVPQNVVADRRIVLDSESLVLDIDNGTKNRGFSPYFIKGLVDYAGAINGQALINDDTPR
ncbi:hypothetical protein YOLOSWAG_119 [Erwinia phage vB_EamM_Yoloswag]|uniref:Uncharacterized protein n=1 Tax=Erwinia phage vB_EamM_Yoloswag TaxID=1958956 RepID=A0A1S6L346_9CAUD|nr:hypothetical protein HOR66_gp119 [Erwinia phage vB_EamM_Yoloswag]AQT28600.1 hypothetical protein YOLOSWAG_119 [Erwinia phage vB_EamM_Yoloswag]